MSLYGTVHWSATSGALALITSSAEVGLLSQLRSFSPIRSYQGSVRCFGDYCDISCLKVSYNEIPSDKSGLVVNHSYIGFSYVLYVNTDIGTRALPLFCVAVNRGCGGADGQRLPMTVA